MSDFILIKDYNPAYRPWIRAALKEKRLMGEREYSMKEAQQMSIDMAARGIKDELFQRFYWYWREHPEYQPDYLHLLELAIPTIYKNGRPDFQVIGRLDSEARGRGQKIILTIEDAAKDFYDYYDRCLIQPLARELESGSSREELLHFLQGEEMKHIPDNKTHTAEEVDEAVFELATRSLEQLRTITPEKILEDIRQTLDEHYDLGVALASPEESYNFKSKYVEISAYRQDGADTSVTTYLTSARGYRPIKEGYEGALYPTYRVYKQESQA